MSFRALGDRIWDHCHLIKFYGCALPHRMTIIQLRDDTLLLHSPTRCDDATRHKLDQMGRVAHIVAPNAMHDLFLQDYAAAYPGARVWIPPGVQRAFSHLPRAEPLPRNPQDAPWHDDLSFLLVEGIPSLNECVFYHARSKSLIFADLFFNIGPENPLVIKIAARLGGFYRTLAMPREMRWFMVRDRTALSRSIQQLRAMPFENVIVGHGSNTVGAAAEALDRATAWLR